MSALDELVNEGNWDVEEQWLDGAPAGYSEVYYVGEAVFKEAAAELSALRERVEALERLEAVAQDVNKWLKTSAGLKGSAHQRELEAALQAP